MYITCQWLAGKKHHFWQSSLSVWLPCNWSHYVRYTVWVSQWTFSMMTLMGHHDSRAVQSCYYSQGSDKMRFKKKSTCRCHLKSVLSTLCIETQVETEHHVDLNTISMFAKVLLDLTIDPLRHFTLAKLCYHVNVVFSQTANVSGPAHQKHLGTKRTTKPFGFNNHRTSDTLPCSPVSCWCLVMFTISMCFSAQLNVHQNLVKEDLGALAENIYWRLVMQFSLQIQLPRTGQGCCCLHACSNPLLASSCHLSPQRMKTGPLWKWLSVEA